MVEGLDFVGGEDGVEEGEFVEAAVEVADGEFRFFTGGEAPVADLGGSDVEGVDALLFSGLVAADFLTIEVVEAGAGGDVVGGDEVKPLFAVGVIPDDGGEEDVVQSSVLSEADGKEELAFVGELPVGFADVVIVGEEEGVVLAVEAVDFRPGGKGEGLVLAGDGDADAGAVGGEVEGLLGRPAAFDRFGGDDGTGGNFLGEGGEIAGPGVDVLHGEVGEDVGLFAESKGVMLPVGESLILVEGDLGIEFSGAGEEAGVGGDVRGVFVGKAEGRALGEVNLGGGGFVPFDFAVEDVEFAFFIGKIEGEFGAEIEDGSARGVDLESDGGRRDVGAKFSANEAHFIGGDDFESGIAFDDEGDAAEEFDLDEAFVEFEESGSENVALGGGFGAFPKWVDDAGEDGEAGVVLFGFERDGGGVGGGIGLEGHHGHDGGGGREGPGEGWLDEREEGLPVRVTCVCVWVTASEGKRSGPEA